MKDKKLFILDVSGYIFRAYFALPPMTNARGEPTHALFGFIRSVLKLLKDFNPEHIVAVFDGPDNKKQRREIYEQYKAHRVQEYSDLPSQIVAAKTFCMHFGIPCLEIEGVEADDAMGSCAHYAQGCGAIVYLCTSDKDLCQLVDSSTFVLNTWKDNLVIDASKVEELYGVKPSQIADLLAIMGDSSDNIPGIKGFGPKTAVALLQEFGSLENLLDSIDQVSSAKKQETLRENRDIALLSKRLATIHTDLDVPKESSFFHLKQPDISSLRHFYLDKGFDTLVRELEAQFKKIEAQDYHLIKNTDELEQLIMHLQTAQEVAFNFFTTDNKPYFAELLGIAFCYEDARAYYIPLDGTISPQIVLDAVKPVFENPSIRFIAHNAKYDLHILENRGIKLKNLTFDTVLASYLLNSASRKHSLEHLVLHYFGITKMTLKELQKPEKKLLGLHEIDKERLCRYCCEEADFIFRLKTILLQLLQERKLDALLFDLEMPLTHLMTKIEQNGMYCDVEQITAFGVEIASSLKELELEIYALAQEEFNINSPKQLSYILFEKLGIKPLKKTATGLSTNADVLEKLATDYPIAHKILAYRSLEKLRSTYVETLPKEVYPKTGRIHPTFIQYGTATGRLACQDPNLQNIPVRTEQGRRIREAFKPQKPNWSYLAADYSQMELRLLAHLSQDPKLIHAFHSGEDIHAFTASLMFGIPLIEVTKLQRYQAKAINFGIIYGQQAFGLSQELGISVKEALAFIEAYFDRYPKVLEFINRSIENTRASGKAVTMIGREREIPDIYSSNMVVRTAAERLAINTPLQGTAADLIKLAMLNINKIIEDEKMHSQMVLQIHDELVFEAPDDELDKLQFHVKEAMENAFALNVPLIVDLHVGKNWAEV